MVAGSALAEQEGEGLAFRPVGKAEAGDPEWRVAEGTGHEQIEP